MSKTDHTGLFIGLVWLVLAAYILIVGCLSMLFFGRVSVQITRFDPFAIFYSLYARTKTPPENGYRGGINCWLKL